MRRRARKRRIKKIILAIMTLTVALIVGVFFMFLQLQHALDKTPIVAQTRRTDQSAAPSPSQPPKAEIPVKKWQAQNKNLPPIYPTLYVTGSSGSPITNMIPMAASVALAANNPAKTGLTLIVETQNQDQIDVTGVITPDNAYPTVVVGTDVGSNDHALYQHALRAVMRYLGTHYNVPYCNMLGYSSAGGGVLRYLIEHNKDADVPPVHKFLSLDGEFNREIGFSEGETFEDILKNGPRQKSPDYLYFEQNCHRLDKAIEIALLECNYNNCNYTDDCIPYSDAFSTFNLLKKNGNRVKRYIYYGSEGHGYVFRNPLALAYVENFFYS